MKKITFYLLLLGLILGGNISYAQNIQIQQGKQSNVTFSKNDYSSLQLNVTLAEINHFTTKTNEGNFAQLIIPGYGSSNVVGNPKIPVLKKIIEVPIGADFSIQIINENYKEFNLADYKIQDKIFPAQPPLSKSVDNPDDIEFKFNKSTYLSNTFLASELVKVVPLGQMRGVQLARLEIAPIQYNPGLNKLKVCTDLTVEITFTGADVGKTINLKKELFSPYFEGLYQSVSNYKNEITDGLITDEPVTYVIVSDPMFQSTLQPFIEWKTKKGFHVIEGYTNDPNVGTTTTSIKAYLQDLYNNPGPGTNPQSFVLFVGDIAQIPAFSGTAGTHVSDLYYCDYTGDIYPECFYGRFSASSIAELQPQIDKTLEYEQYLMPDPSFLDEVLMVTGDDSSHELTWGNGQINYGTTYYFNAAHGLNSHTFLQPANNTEIHDSIIANVNNGISYGNYSAHCSSNGWATPSFSISDIAGLTNNHKYSLLVGNCCLSNQFDVDDCFGEEILQAVDKGALGYIGGSNSTYWDEDYWWGVGYETVSANPVYNAANLGSYDRTFHDNGEPTSEWFTTQGQMPSAGNLAVTQAASSLETYYWEIYHLMGDPSLMVYMSQPPITNATYAGLIPLGAATFTVNTEPYSYVGITKDGVLHGAGIANAAGFVEVIINPVITVPGTADIVVTRQNGQPFIGTVTVASPSGPYLSLESFVIDDNAGNNNGEADYDEDIILDITLENLGSSLATNVSAILSSSDSYLTITDNIQTWNDIPDGTTSTQTGAYAVTISNDVADQHIVEFELEITDGSEIWNTTFQITIQAPILEFGNMTINDAIGGDGNGRLDPGETADISVEILNTGHSNSPDAVASLSSLSEWLTINSATYPLGIINVSDIAFANFNITCDILTPIGTPVDLTFDINAGNYGINKTFFKKVGLVLEDWETGNFGNFPWTFAGEANWEITDVGPYEGIYCSKSSTISDSQTAELVIDVITTADDEISFFRKVSSESNYDKLQFYIDATMQEEWSGTVDWSEVSYPVTTGAHTFKWVYLKDGSVSSGADCAWVDYIIFPPIQPPLAPASIQVNPGSFEVNLPADDVSVQQLSIANIGEMNLDFSLLKSYQIKSNKAYCDASGGCDEYIDGIEFGDISNLGTGCSNYADYTNLSTVVVPGTTYPIIIYTGNSYTSDDYTVWIDWNENDDFTDPGEEMICEIGVGADTNTFNITVPFDVISGNKTMRIRLKYSGTDCGNPCGTTSYGEVEDYTVIVSSDFKDWLSFNPTSGIIPGTGMTNIDVEFNTTGMDEGTYYADILANSNDPINPQIIVPCTLNVGGSRNLSLKVYLEGPFDETEMKTDLNIQDLIPNNQPYNTSPWNYTGTESVSGMPNADVIDWILLEFRDAPGDVTTATPSTTIAYQAGLLLKDGSIVGMDGASLLPLNYTINNNLYIVIHHRNHIPIMSSTAITLNGGLYEYDFTGSETMVYGGANGYVEIVQGIWGMVAGDGVCDGNINMDDKIIIWEPQSGNNGYFNGDFNMNGEIDNKDKNGCWKPNIGSYSQEP